MGLHSEQFLNFSITSYHYNNWGSERFYSRGGGFQIELEAYDIHCKVKYNVIICEINVERQNNM